MEKWGQSSITHGAKKLFHGKLGMTYTSQKIRQITTEFQSPRKNFTKFGEAFEMES